MANFQTNDVRGRHHLHALLSARKRVCRVRQIISPRLFVGLAGGGVMVAVDKLLTIDVIHINAGKGAG